MSPDEPRIRWTAMSSALGLVPGLLIAGFAVGALRASWLGIPVPSLLGTMAVTDAAYEAARACLVAVVILPVIVIARELPAGRATARPGRAIDVLTAFGVGLSGAQLGGSAPWADGGTTTLGFVVSVAAWAVFVSLAFWGFRNRRGVEGPGVRRAAIGLCGSAAATSGVYAAVRGADGTMIFIGALVVVIVAIASAFTHVFVVRGFGEAVLSDKRVSCRVLVALRRPRFRRRCATRLLGFGRRRDERVSGIARRGWGTASQKVVNCWTRCGPDGDLRLLTKWFGSLLLVLVGAAMAFFPLAPVAVLLGPGVAIAMRGVSRRAADNEPRWTSLGVWLRPSSVLLAVAVATPLAAAPISYSSTWDLWTISKPSAVVRAGMPRCLAHSDALLLIGSSKDRPRAVGLRFSVYGSAGGGPAFDVDQDCPPADVDVSAGGNPVPNARIHLSSAPSFGSAFVGLLSGKVVGIPTPGSPFLEWR
ncbi:hypothetical protein AB0L40_19050 [Patulibacter sp. NPDC049589]|uniref:hypothetical protein n=1 Tax=Patulibacter sp. NPDC049589 TaxID=3154731 RepID=UPI003423C532